MYRREASNIKLCRRVSNTSVSGARGVSSGSGWGCQVGGGRVASNGVEQDKTMSRVPNH